MTKLTDIDKSSKVVIGELTSVRVGLIVFLVGAIVSSVWWAATITSKLDSILSNQSAYQAATSAALAEMKSDINDIKIKQAVDESAIKDIKDKNLIVPIK